ncbi:putative protein-S-isoprenylcysteine O-methyltransferase [Platanthera guangdongensis]|uniref:Protein-S-isoprenylcysteine O-methyltransferase n=1 Tax=Platanthera guangdongensis TaxID=2320717 RepID=A0ABR2MNG3_9ASPA
MITRQYIIAMAFSMFEYYIEVSFLPELKAQWWITNIGLLMVLTGEAIRKVAILTAGSAFTHIIRVDHDDCHELIIRGIYSYHLAEWMNQLLYSRENYLAELEELQLSSFAFQAVPTGLELSSLMEKKMSCLL